MHAKNLHTLTGRNKTSGMQGIPVTQARSKQSFTVMVYSHSPHTDFVTTITIKIRYGHTMISHTRIGLPTRCRAIKSPCMFQCPVCKSPCSYHRPSVPSSYHDRWRRFSIQKSYSGCKTVWTTTSIVITTIATYTSPTIQRITGWNIFFRIQFFSGTSFKNREIFRTIYYLTIRRTLFIPCPPVDLGISYPMSQSIDSTISRFTTNFRTSISIKIKDQKISRGCSGTYIRPQINTPQPGSIHFICIQIGITGKAPLWRSLWIRRRPF